MKASTLLLLGSLLANGALVATLVLIQPGAAVTTASPARAVTATTTAAVAAKSVPPSAALTPVPNAWSRLRADNFGELGRRLRAAGFPAREVRAMVAMAISAQFTERNDAILGNPADIPYWKNQSRMGVDPALQAQLSEAYREQGELNYRYVSGPDALAENEDLLVAAKRRFGDLPLGKLQQLMAMQHDLDDLRNQAFAPNRDSAAIRSTGEVLRALDQEHLAAVAKLLTPAELEQYELRNNAGGVRRELANFRPSEEEFKALYAASKIAGQLGGPPDPAITEAILTPDRYAEYLATRSSDGQGKLGQLIARLDLPMTTVPAVNAVRDDINARAKAVLADTALPAADRNAALAALALEAQRKLTSSLGDRGYRAYAELKGDWLRALKPKGP